MKKIFHLLIIAFLHVVLFSCNENEMMKFAGDSTIYFRVPEADSTLIVQNDTVVYSFAFEDPTKVQSYVLRIPVESTGAATTHARKYKIDVVSDQSNAVSGVDYIELQNEYTMPANQGLDTLSITLKRTPAMQESARKLVLEFIATSEFKTGIEERKYIHIRISDILERPQWWDTWEQFMGTYGRKKHEKWLLIWGKVPLPTDIWQIHPFQTPKELMAIQDLRIYFEQNPTYENGERVIVPKIY